LLYLKEVNGMAIQERKAAPEVRLHTEQ